MMHAGRWCARRLRPAAGRAVATQHVPPPQRWPTRRVPPRHSCGCTRAATSGNSGAVSTAGPGASNSEGVVLSDMQLGPLSVLQQRLCVGGTIFTLLAPTDVDAVIDLYIDAGIEDGDPYWTRAWPSSISLASLIMARPELVAGKKVADVGCGLGLAGIAAALAGAREVVLLDREPLALHCALASAAASGVPHAALPSLEPEPLHGWGAAAAADRRGAPPPAASARVAGDIGCCAPAPSAASTPETHASGPMGGGTTPAHAANGARLSGAGLSRYYAAPHAPAPGAAAPSSAAVPPSQLVRARTFDWDRSELLGDTFDVLLACDVLYEDYAVEPIARLVPRLLSPRSGSRMVLADPPNRTPKNRERFLSLVRGAPGINLALEEVSMHDCVSKLLDNEMAGGTEQSIPIQLCMLRAAEGGNTVGIKL